jgi:hypothetical protein
VNPQEIFAAEFFIVIAINTWGAIRHGYWPWPATMVRCCLAIAILNFLSLITPELAVVLSAGFLLALLLTNLQAAGGKITDIFGAVPPAGVQYDVLTIPGS